MQLLAYFGALPRGARSLPASSKAYATSPAWGRAIGGILAAKPYAVRLDAIKVKMLHHPQLSRDELLRSLDASIVGLGCEIKGDVTDTTNEADQVSCTRRGSHSAFFVPMPLISFPLSMALVGASRDCNVSIVCRPRNSALSGPQHGHAVSCDARPCRDNPPCQRPHARLARALSCSPPIYSTHSILTLSGGRPTSWRRLCYKRNEVTEQHHPSQHSPMKPLV